MKLLTALTRLFGRGAAPKPKYEWPDTEPPDAMGNPVLGCNVNGKQYHKVEIAPGRWQWRVNEAAMKRLAAEDKHRRGLWQALRTRALTDDELKQVAQYGTMLNVEYGVAYHADTKAQELNAALTLQAVLQVRAARS